MSADRWARLKSVFYEALEQPQERRRAWLAAACKGDESLLEEAAALLAAHETAGDFLEQPAEIDANDLDATQLVPGTMLGPYEVLEEIARGGMGIVYLAQDQRLGRRVALKALPVSLAGDTERRERLRREARAAATISHPAVATVYALEEVDGALLIASEYVPGRTLRRELDRGPLHPDRVRTIATDIARALCAAHEAGVIHRDLKPENVLITDDGNVKVVDFGIAHVEGTERTRLTRAGAMLGTPAYMAPEQLLGGTIDARADIYSFGVVLSEMLSGHHPLTASQAQRLASGPLAGVVERCMHADPAARFASARELLQAVQVPFPPAASPAKWWWEFHQAAASVAYGLMLIPVWTARAIVGGAPGRSLFIVAAIAVTVSATLRLHLWFTARFYPAELPWVRARAHRWLRTADWLVAATLIVAGFALRDDREALAALLAALGFGIVVAFLVIEPVTARAAFGNSSGTPS